MAQTANEKLYDETLRRRLEVLAYAYAFSQDVLGILAEVEADLLEKIGGMLAQASTQGRRIDRLEELMRSVQVERSKAYARVRERATVDLYALARDEARWESELIRAVVPVNLELARVTPEALRAVVRSPIQGLPFKDWLGSIEQAELTNVVRQLRIGILQGETTDEIVKRITGPSGLLSITYRSADSLARTAVLHVSNQAREEVFTANADIIAALRWTATLDGRTSPICQARDGHYAAIAGRELPEGLEPLDPPGARPPAHFNCRSVMVALLDGIALSGVRPFVADDRTRAQREDDFKREARERRVSVRQVRRDWADRTIGQAPADTTYEQWLRRQAPSLQDRILGEKRAGLFRSGASLDKFVDSSTGRRVTLDELAAMGLR